MESEKRLYKKMVRLVVMVKKKEDINKRERKVGRTCKKRAIEVEKGWMIVRGETKVILINEDDLVITPLKKTEIKNPNLFR